jgi:hypothetical protein
VKQGFWPGARAPYGYRSVPVEVRPGLERHGLEVESREAALVREAFTLYIAGSGAKSVARMLNQRGLRTRAGDLWSKSRVTLLLSEEALTGTVHWGMRKDGLLRPRAEWLSLTVRVGSELRTTLCVVFQDTPTAFAPARWRQGRETTRT